MKPSIEGFADPTPKSTGGVVAGRDKKLKKGVPPSELVPGFI